MYGQISFESLLLTMVALVCVIVLLGGFRAVARSPGNRIGSMRNYSDTAVNWSVLPYSAFKIYMG
jgi:hypothetical protein